MAEPLFAVASARDREASAAERMTRAMGYLWLSAAYAAAGAMGCGLGALAASAATWLGIVVGSVTSALVLFGFDWFHRSTRFVELMWSLGPLVIAVAVLRFAPSEGSSPVRRVLVLVVILLWSLRAAALWVRRFRGPREESSIHARLRERYGDRFAWVSLGALHVAPALVLALGAMSFLPIFSTGRSGLNILDIAASTVTLAGLVIGAVAEHQLRRFTRTSRIPTRVCDEGLFSVCRHPRYLGDMMFWWGIALFALAAEASALWAVLGPLALSLVLVFYAAPRRERRELERRPDYAHYRTRVPAFLPRVFR
ncbi:MAG: DUF1295 domain-containing protein [Polyangiaceae bacterium]